MGVVLSSHSMSLDGFVVQADRTPGAASRVAMVGRSPSRHSDSIKLSTESREWFDSGTVMGGDMTRQCLAAGLLDEIDIDLVPILLGEGAPLFRELADAPVELELQRIVDAPGVTHLSFRVANKEVP